jgi:hypothetical protein
MTADILRLTVLKRMLKSPTHPPAWSVEQGYSATGVIFST